MTMPRRLRKLVLTVHVTVSVGWLGAIAAFLALALVGLTHEDPVAVRGVYLVMEPTAWLVLVPLAVASLLTGVLQSLGSPWGLLRHYWVVLKLGITAVSTLVLLTYMDTFAAMAATAADPGSALGAVRNPSPAVHAGAALVLLISAATLSVVKPRGLTRYGWRRQRRPAAHI